MFFRRSQPPRPEHPYGKCECRCGCPRIAWRFPARFNDGFHSWRVMVCGPCAEDIDQTVVLV